MTYDPKVYGYVNGKATYSRDEFIYEARRRGPIETDAELMAFAEKVTGGWSDAGWQRSFARFYLSEYALAEPKASLTAAEFSRLKQLQKEVQEAEAAADAARDWKLKQTVHYADNSTEEIWQDKDGNTKTIMAVYPHGDAC